MIDEIRVQEAHAIPPSACDPRGTGSANRVVGNDPSQRVIPANAREKRNRVTALSVNTHDPCQLAWEKDSTTAARIRQA